MPPLIHPTAVISPDAVLAADTRVGPYAVIEGTVTVGAGCAIGPHTHLSGPLTIGRDNTFGTGAVIGGPPQHLAYRGELTAIEIGDGNSFREHTTVHRGMPLGVGPGTGLTRIGNNNLFMAGCHVGHDCRVGNLGIFVNSTLLGGHVETAERVMCSGNSAVHQFCRIGRLALLSGVSACSKDIPPFWVIRDVNRVCGINVIGMRRAGIGTAEIQAVRLAFRLICRDGLTVPVALAQIEAQVGEFPAIRELVAFVRASRRGLCGPGDFHPGGESAAA